MSRDTRDAHPKRSPCSFPSPDTSAPKVVMGIITRVRAMSSSTSNKCREIHWDFMATYPMKMGKWTDIFFGGVINAWISCGNSQAWNVLISGHTLHQSGHCHLMSASHLIQLLRNICTHQRLKKMVYRGISWYTGNISFIIPVWCQGGWKP